MKNLVRKENLLWLTLTIVIYAIVSFLISARVITTYYQITLVTIGINIILAVSLNLIIGVCGQFSLGHAGFMCIGSYSAAIVLKYIPGYYGLIVGILVGLVISGLVAFTIALPTLRLRGDYLAIATLGFAEIIRVVINNMKITNGAAGISNIPKLTSFGVLYFAIVVTLLVVVNFKRSAPGRACSSIKEDEIASEAMGINTTKYKIIAFVIGAILASVAGALSATYFYFIKPSDFSFVKSIDILVIVVFGGMGSMTGSVISGIVLGIINLILQNYPNERMIVYSLVIIAIMVYKPGGLLKTNEFTFSGLFKRFSKKDEVAK